jgi:UDP-glucose 4-epimerase
MKVFVTGSSSRLATALLPRLCARTDVESVTGIDLVPPRFQNPKFRAVQTDIRNPLLERLLDGHDALVHLAFVVMRGRMSEQEMFDINVSGSHKAFNAARRAGVRRFIHMSSAAVYGEGVHLGEDAPLEPPPQFLYARQEAHLEKLLEIEFPECVRFRPHIILGPHAQPLFRQLFNQPCYVRMPEPLPLLQCVHEDDVAQAVLLALGSDARGPFNLATDDNFTFRDVIRRRHRLSLPLPSFAARAALNLARRCFGWGGDPAWAEGFSRTLLVNCRHAHVELDWRSAHDAASVLAQT